MCLLVLGKKPEISSPSNFEHTVHVGFDPYTGEFTVSIKYMFMNFYNFIPVTRYLKFFFFFISNYKIVKTSIILFCGHLSTLSAKAYIEIKKAHILAKNL